MFAPPASTSIVSDFTAEVSRGQTDSAGHLPRPLPNLGRLLVVVDHPNSAPLVQEIIHPVGELRLTPGDQVTGRIALEGNQAIRGRVCAQWTRDLPDWSRKLTFERCGGIGSDRRWIVSGLGEGEVRLLVQADGFLPAASRAQAGSERIFRLERGFLVVGRLVDPAGLPVLDAEIQSPGANPSQVDENGSFTATVPALPADLHIRASGFRPQDVRAARTSIQEPIRLEWSQQVRGILLGPSGQPLSKAKLVASLWVPKNHGWMPEEIELAPEDDGTFEADLPAPGEYRLRFVSEGLRSEPTPAQLITQGAVIDLGAVLLETGAGVRCRVVAEAGAEPIAGVEARLVGRGSGLLVQLLEGSSNTATTNAKGEFSVTGAEPGAYRLRLRHAGYATASLNLDLEPGEIQDCGEVSLAPALEVAGRVSTREGRPVGGVRLRFFEPPADGLEPAADAITDENGRFSGVRVSAGRYEIWVDSERRLLTQSHTLEKSDTGRDVDLSLIVPGVRVRLHLVRGGQAIEGGGWVSLTSELDLSDARLKMQFQSGGEVTRGHELLGRADRPLAVVVPESGPVEFVDAPAGPVRLDFIAPDGTTASRRLSIADLPEAELTVELGGYAVQGRLIDAETGAGLGGRVEVVDEAGRLAGDLPSDSDGTFEGQDFAAGAYVLRALVAGYSPVFQRVELPRRATTPLKIALRESVEGAVALRFQRSDGSPAAGLVAHLLDEAGRLRVACVLEITGRCRWPSVPKGSYSLAWSDPVTGVGGVPILEVEGGEEVGIAYQLVAGGVLTLRCAECAQAPLESLSLVSSSGLLLTPYLEGMAPALRFGADGLLTLGRLNAGSYVVSARAAGREVTLRLEVQPQGDPVLELDSLPGGSP